MKLLFSDTQILFVIYFGICCSFFLVNCDSSLQQRTGSNSRDQSIQYDLDKLNKTDTGNGQSEFSSLPRSRITRAERDDREGIDSFSAIKLSTNNNSARTIIVKRSAKDYSSRKKPKIHLATRPKGSTTTTTTTSSTTTTPSSEDDRGKVSESESEANEENEDTSDEYEEVEENKPAEEASVDTSTTSTTGAPTTTKPASKLSNKTSANESKLQKSAKPAPKEVQSASELKRSRASSNQTNRTIKVQEEPTPMRKKPLMALPFIRPKNASVCIPEAYLEFPRDLIGSKWRGHGLIVVHIAVVCYMFYSLALVCERYFMPSLEEFAQRLQLSEDVAGATLMSAGSSAPELFTAILGVFIAKGDIGTGTIVGSAVFNILFVIGVCAFVSTTSAQLQWWPVLRDSVFYSFTVLVLILCIYDERVTAFESFSMLALYGVYILIMIHNEFIKDVVTRKLLSHPVTANLISSAVSIEGPDDVFGSPGFVATGSSNPVSSSDKRTFFSGSGSSKTGPGKNYQTTSTIAQQYRSQIEEDSMFLAACLIMVRHKRLFKSQLRFQSAARYIIVKRQHKLQQHQLEQQQQQQQKSQSNEVNYFGPETNEPLNEGNQRDRREAYARSASMSKNKFSIVSKDDYEFWNRPPEDDENYYLWLAKIPVNYVLHYTVPDCSLHPDKYIITFIVSILWTALFSYIMVWMVTLIGYTLGIPDSVMGATFLAAGTSVPDCYSSIHAARNGMADMAVSNSIGSNVFDILVGLSLPWFIQTAIYPGVVATINSRGVIYSVVLLFLSLIVTIYLLNKYEWTLKPRLGLALLIAYGLFIILSCMLEFNIFGHVNPPSCPVD